MIKQYLENLNIDYTKSGTKNVSKGWIGIECPFCQDGSNHCGINIQSGTFNCWVCGEKGNLAKLIKKLENCSWHSAYKKSEEMIDNNMLDLGRIKKTNLLRIELPKECQEQSEYMEKSIPRMHYEYLIKRNFDPIRLSEKYKLHFVYNFGKYKFRIIIPHFLNDQLVAFSARDVTNQSQYPYLKSNNCNQTIYNLDSINDRCIIVEGVTDVWRIDNDCCAIGSKTFTKNQILLLKEKKLKKVLILYDADDFNKRIGERLGNQLAEFILEVEVLFLDNGDPCDMDKNEIKEIKEMLYK